MEPVQRRDARQFRPLAAKHPRSPAAHAPSRSPVPRAPRSSSPASCTRCNDRTPAPPASSAPNPPNSCAAAAALRSLSTRSRTASRAAAHPQPAAGAAARLPPGLDRPARFVPRAPGAAPAWRSRDRRLQRLEQAQELRLPSRQRARRQLQPQHPQLPRHRPLRLMLRIRADQELKWPRFRGQLR